MKTGAMTTERWLTAALLALAVLAGSALQQGLVNPGRVTSALIRVGAGLSVPPLDDPAMIRRGAAHYDIVCAGCHASPASPTRADHLRLTPPAPRLHLRVENWLPEVLFLTVKHGIRDTAMPAWPAADRDDEVWAMVAFLRVLPDLDRDRYRALAGLDSTAAVGAPDGSAICARCHGPAGRGDPNGAFPRLDIQTALYLGDALRAYRAGQRQSGYMAAMAGALTDDDLAELSRHFAAPASAPALVVKNTNASPVADRGIAGSHVPACSACHGPGAAVRPAFPALAGQYAPYLASQLRLFAAEEFTRGGGPFANLMREAGHDLTEADITAISAGLGVAGDTPSR